MVNNSNESYEELLSRNNEVSIHQKQLRILATEVFKSLIGIIQILWNHMSQQNKYHTACEIDVFWKYHHHNLRVMEQIRFYFEHVWYGKSHLLLLNKVSHSKYWNRKLKIWQKLTAPAKFAVYNFMFNSDKGLFSLA